MLHASGVLQHISVLSNIFVGLHTQILLFDDHWRYIACLDVRYSNSTEPFNATLMVPNLPVLSILRALVELLLLRYMCNLRPSINTYTRSPLRSLREELKKWYRTDRFRAS